MIRFAIIGTNWITEKFIQATQQSGEMELTAIYSRQLNRAEQFAKAYNISSCFTSLPLLAASNLIDAIYIASPTLFHAQQSLLFLQHNKHVICEKPAASNEMALKKVIQEARQRQLIYFEAFKTAYLPNFQQLKNALSRVGKIRKVFLNYCQYSSRYPGYLKGEYSNTFNPVFANGSLMDIGFYCLASAVTLFGEPKQVTAQATLLETGVDGAGTVLLRYDGFDVIIQHSKISDSRIASEIQGEKGTFVIDNLADSQTLHFYPIRNSADTSDDLTLPQHDNILLYEVQAVAKLIHDNHVDHEGLERACITAKLLTDIRRQTGVIFPADPIGI